MHTENIDGIVALAMAVGRWMAEPAASGFNFRVRERDKVPPPAADLR
jgi:hypothetical protein